MALTYGFYNSLKGDRKYDAEQVSAIFDGILKDGIIPSYGQLFDVNTASNGMQITVGTGRAWFHHTWTLNDSVMVLTVPQSDITRDRYDTVVLEVNHEDAVRANAIKIVEGTPAVNPQKPTLVNTEKVHQYPLAYILVKAGSETVPAENIENMVGRTPTVFATGILETVPIDDLWSQWEGEWHTWFEGIKLQLSGDIVTNLQLQIDRLKEKHESDFSRLAAMVSLIQKNQGSVTVSVTDQNGTPIKNMPILNLATDTGEIAVTSASGIATGYAAPQKDFRPEIGNYIDIESINASSTDVVAGGTHNVSVAVTKRNFYSSIASTKIKFSPLVKSISFSVVGGGGGGCGPRNASSAGGGGGGGGVTIAQNILVVSGTEYEIQIGTGGYGGNGISSNGSKGGQSSFMGYTAEGGDGGTTSAGGAGASGGGNGGNPSAMSGTAGKNGTIDYFTSYTESVSGPGGGGGGGIRMDATSGWASSGGTSGGGKGGYVTYQTVGTSGFKYTAFPSTSGIKGGGGGGGGTPTSNEYPYAASGGSGYIGIRINF